MNTMKLIRFLEKHDNRNFVYSTDEELFDIFIKIARERLQDGYWFDTTPKGEPGLFHPIAHLSDAETISLWLNKLDKPELRQGKSGGNVPDTLYYKRQIYLWMQKRCSHQYEGFDIDHIESL